jgi:hypothetical protein
LHPYTFSHEQAASFHAAGQASFIELPLVKTP